MPTKKETADPGGRPFFFWLGRLLLLLSGAVPVLALAGPSPDSMMLIWPAFVAVWLFRAPLGRAVAALPWSPHLSLCLAFILTGQLTETLAWGSDVWRGNGYPAVFHPQLFVDLALAVGFYGGLGVGWAVLSRRYQYSLLDVFAIAGVYGILVEQDGAILTFVIQSITTDPLNAAIAAGYVFIVYGSFSGLAFAPTLAQLSGRTRHWSRYGVALAACLILPRLGFALMLGVFALFGGLPKAQSALDHPFW